MLAEVARQRVGEPGQHRADEAPQLLPLRPGDLAGHDSPIDQLRNDRGGHVEPPLNRPVELFVAADVDPAGAHELCQ